MYVPNRQHVLVMFLPFADKPILFSFQLNATQKVNRTKKTVWPALIKEEDGNHDFKIVKFESSHHQLTFSYVYGSFTMIQKNFSRNIFVSMTFDTHRQNRVLTISKEIIIIVKQRGNKSQKRQLFKPNFDKNSIKFPKWFV